MMKLAQNTLNLYDPATGNLKGFGPLGLENKSTTEGGIIFTNFISSAVGLITIIGVIWFVFIIITGAVAIITSGGDKASLEGAKKKITNGIIGLVVTISALFILNLIGTILGIPDILNFTKMFTRIVGGGGIQP